MYEGCAAKIRMIQTILEDGFFDEREYPCKVITYNEEREMISFLLEDAELPSVSLDGIYGCRIVLEKEQLCCRGRIVERFGDKRGNAFIFRVENGFYKNNLN